jgi:hypothetical protein
MYPTFDGSNVDRNLNLEKAMQIVSGKLKEGQVLAAGFTDIHMTDPFKVEVTLSRIASNLDSEFGGLTREFATRYYGSLEYTVIYVNKNFVVGGSGRVMRVNQKKGDPLWQCVTLQDVLENNLENKAAASQTASENAEKYFEAKSRGLAYVCGKFRGEKMIIGFTHKISAEGRENTYQLLTDIMKLIWDKHPDYSGCPTIFGGDFTFAPAPTAGPCSAVYAWDSTADPGDMEPLPTSDKEGFDFWFTNADMPYNRASRHEETCGIKLTRHYGISLRLRMRAPSEEVKK